MSTWRGYYEPSANHIEVLGEVFSRLELRCVMRRGPNATRKRAFGRSPDDKQIGVLTLGVRYSVVKDGTFSMYVRNACEATPSKTLRVFSCRCIRTMIRDLRSRLCASTRLLLILEPHCSLFLDSSMVEHSAVNRGVVGSSPTRGGRVSVETSGPVMCL